MKNKNSQSWCERRCVENCKSCDAFVLRLRRVLKTSYKNLPRRTFKAKKTDGSITTKNGRKDKVPKSGLEGTQGSYLIIFFKKVLARTQIVIVDIASDVRSSSPELMKKRDEARNKNKRIWKKSKKNCRKSAKKGAKKGKKAAWSWLQSQGSQGKPISPKHSSKLSALDGVDCIKPNTLIFRTMVCLQAQQGKKAIKFTVSGLVDH